MDNLETNPVFLALTRPPMMFGVTIDVLLVECMSLFILFMLSHQVMILTLFFPLYLTSWILCYSDPNYFKVLFTRLNCGFSPLQSLWGCHSYAPF
jgi:type IV secretion system protein VirB3